MLPVRVTDFLSHLSFWLPAHVPVLPWGEEAVAVQDVCAQAIHCLNSLGMQGTVAWDKWSGIFKENLPSGNGFLDLNLSIRAPDICNSLPSSLGQTVRFLPLYFLISFLKKDGTLLLCFNWGNLINTWMKWCYLNKHEWSDAKSACLCIWNLSKSAATSEIWAVGGLLIASNPSSVVLRKKIPVFLLQCLWIFFFLDAVGL